MKRFLINTVIAVVIILPMLTVNDKPYLLSLPLIGDLENAAYDWRQKQNADIWPEPDENFAIVDIDAATIRSHGAPPWHNDLISELIVNLRDVHGAKLVVLVDPLRNDSGRQSDAVFQKLIESFSFDPLLVNSVRQIQTTYDADSSLRQGLDGRYVMIPYEFDDSARKINVLPDPKSFAADGEEITSHRMVMRESIAQVAGFTGYYANPAQFYTYSAGSGFVTRATDPDGKARRMQLVGSYAGELYPSLALESLRFFENPSLPASFAVRADSRVLGAAAIESVSVGSFDIPLASDGSMLLNYNKVRTPKSAFRYHSAGKLLDPDTRPIAELRGKVAIVGSSSAEVNDLQLTPVGLTMPRVELFALGLSNIVSGEYLILQPNAWLLEAAGLILLGLLLSFALPRLSPIFSLLVTIAIGALLYYVNFEVAWKGNGNVYRIAPFAMLLALMFIINILSGFLIEWNSKRHVQGVLGQYLPPELARKFGESKKSFSMEGEIREMTVLFSDVRGFTGISEKFAAHDLTKFMNQMLTVLSQVIHANKGTIDKYIGDAVMAFWNAPLDDEQHATNSVRAALGMQQAMAKLSDQLVARGLPELKMGVGINSGEACVGNMGSSIRLAYTVMGDTVNLSSRLEGITKQYGIPIIVGEKTYELSKEDILYRPVDSVRVKGKEQAVTVYEPLAEMRYSNPALIAHRDLSVQIWEAYCARRFADMQALLETALAQHPSDGLLLKYAERAVRLLEAPPGDDWEPVTNYDTK